MSHLPERKEKDCLNCGAVVRGRYCHQCGQENKVLRESAWHLFTHFVNDITHFDGKFFSSLKLLITKPGFLSREYFLGRRARYLNPIRMYIFTSAIYFLIFYSTITPEKTDTNQSSLWEDSVRIKVNNITEDQFKLYLADAGNERLGFCKTELFAGIRKVKREKKYHLCKNRGSK